MIACRLACYRPFEELAAQHLRDLGIRFVEVRLPPPERLVAEPHWAAAEAERLARHGLAATTVHGDLDLLQTDTGAQVLAIAPRLRELRCGRLFVALRPMPLPHTVQCDRLRKAGDAAAAEGLTIVLETHPDLTPNANRALETLARVEHPAVRLNFDTANVYFYNRGLDCVRELRRVAAFVESVHLKDTTGVFSERNFPALGEGVIDFAGVFGVLDAAGFDGPCTLETEGVPGEERTAAQILRRIEASVAHLQRLGRL